MILPGETVRIAARSRKFDGTLRDDTTISAMVVDITQRSTGVKVAIQEPLDFDQASQEFVGYWPAGPSGKYVLTVTCVGTDDTVAIESRGLTVAGSGWA